MSKYLINIDEESYKVEDSVYDAVPEFKVLKKSKIHGSKTISWIVLMYDKRSPYRNLPEQERSKAVTQEIYKKDKFYILKKPEVTAAVRKYKELSYDPLEEQYSIFGDKIHSLNQYIEGFDVEGKLEDVEKLQKVMFAMDKIVESREKLRKIIEKRDQEEEQTRGGSQKSYLEELLTETKKK